MKTFRASVFYFFLTDPNNYRLRIIELDAIDEEDFKHKAAEVYPFYSKIEYGPISRKR